MLFAGKYRIGELATEITTCTSIHVLEILVQGNFPRVGTIDDYIIYVRTYTHVHTGTVINLRRACAARVIVLGLCVCVCVCLCVCLSPLILALQGPSRLVSDTNGSSATRARKNMWRFCLNGGVREIWR